MTGYDKSARGGKKGNTAGRGKPREDRRRSDGEAPVEAGAADSESRIAKVLARLGVASRRDAEEMVREGRVSVNGKRLDTPAVTVSFSDRIEVDGNPVASFERTRLWLYHKPAGLVTTNKDPEGRPTVFDNLPPDLPRVMSVGRLDINTEGLLLLTNDGGLARTLELPATGWLRRYRVRAYGDIDQERLDTLKDGIAVDGVLYGAIEAVLDRTQGHNVWLTIGLREGKNREIKNVLGALGLDVNRLIRISFGPFQLGEIGEGEAVEIKSRTLREQLGDRLAEESGANFDAPVTDHRQKSEPQDEKPARQRRTFGEEGGRDWVSAGDPRERARAKLDTKPRTPPRRRGAANVWMAPGARPEGAEKKPKRPRPAEGAPDRANTRKSGGGAPRRDRSERPDAERRPRQRAEAGGATRSERPKRDDARPRRDRDGGAGRPDKPFSRDGRRDERRDERKPAAGRSDRSERGAGEKRAFDKPRAKPAGRPAARPEGRPAGRPAGASGESRSFDKPRERYRDKPRDDKRDDRRDKPRGKPFARSDDGRETRSEGAPAGKPAGSRGGKPFGKPGGGKLFGKPGAGKSFGKPGGGKPGARSSARPGGKPAGDRTSGSKPGGRPSGGAPRGGSGGGPKGRGGADRRR